MDNKHPTPEDIVQHFHPTTTSSFCCFLPRTQARCLVVYTCDFNFEFAKSSVPPRTEGKGNLAPHHHTIVLMSGTYLYCLDLFYRRGVFSSKRDFREHLRGILLLHTVETVKGTSIPPPNKGHAVKEVVSSDVVVLHNCLLFENQSHFELGSYRNMSRLWQARRFWWSSLIQWCRLAELTARAKITAQDLSQPQGIVNFFFRAIKYCMLYM